MLYCRIYYILLVRYCRIYYSVLILYCRIYCSVLVKPMLYCRIYYTVYWYRTAGFISVYCAARFMKFYF